MQSKVHLKKIEMQVAPRLKAKAKLMHSKIEHESQGKSKGHKPRPTHLNSTPPQHTSNSPTQQLQQHPPKKNLHNIFTAPQQHPHNTSTTPQHHTYKARVHGFWVPRARVHGPLHGFRVSRLGFRGLRLWVLRLGFRALGCKARLLKGLGCKAWV